MSDWKNINSKLEEREIQPSTSAWGKLDQQLTDFEENTSPKSYKRIPFWVGVAASVILIAVISILLWNNSSDSIENQIITTNEKQTIQEKIESDVVLDAVKENTIDEETTSTPYVHTEIKNEPITNQKVVRTSDIQSPVFKEIPLENIVSATLPIEDTVDTTRLALVPADILLKQALTKRKLIKEKHIVVDGGKLLNQVENELFEEKSPDLLEKLTNQIKTIQVALSERNEKK